MWLVHVVAPPKNEGCQIDTNKVYTILKWNIKVHLVVLAQVQTFKIKCIRKLNVLKFAKHKVILLILATFILQQLTNII
jgi:hypothetical protein